MTDEFPEAFTDEPTDPLTELAQQIMGPLSDDEHESVRGILILNDGGTIGVMSCGYDNPRDVVGDLLYNVRAIIRAAGGDFELMTVGRIPDDLRDL